MIFVIRSVAACSLIPSIPWARSKVPHGVFSRLGSGSMSLMSRFSSALLTFSAEVMYFMSLRFMTNPKYFNAPM